MPTMDFKQAIQSGKKPLQGVRVIDAGNMVAAPFSSVLMADLGADVIKIEHPEQGDGQRKLEPIKDGIPLWWKCISRNKRCVTINLSKPEGAEVFKDLVRGADVAMENYRPGTLEVEPAQCLSCGFTFEERGRFRRPSRCPQCRSERLQPPRFWVRAR